MIERLFPISRDTIRGGFPWLPNSRIFPTDETVMVVMVVERTVTVLSDQLPW